MSQSPDPVRLAAERKWSLGFDDATFGDAQHLALALAPALPSPSHLSLTPFYKIIRLRSA
jgi:hypothetical protein